MKKDKMVVSGYGPIQPLKDPTKEELDNTSLNDLLREYAKLEKELKELERKK